MTDAIDREWAYQERLRRAYDERRSVQLRLTPKQAKALVDYLNREHETKPFPTVLCMAVHEVESALEAAG